MKNKIGFVWQGIDGMYGKWHDGLYQAMKILESEYEVDYLEPDYDLDGYDVLLYWEAPCTINGQNADKYNRVRNHHGKKILLFAGGPINPKWVEGFDLVCVESQINKEEFEQIGMPVVTAFGINDELFKPVEVEKEYDVVHHGTCASWKRQWLLPQAFPESTALIGRFQHEDSHPFRYSEELGAKILGELHDEELVESLCKAKILVQSSDYWGGGQRATLEAMACGLPVICMEDSPKNREYVEESGAGLVSKPEPNDIKRCFEEIISNYDEFSSKGIEYVKNKWTANHYAIELNQAIKQVCKTRN